MRLAEVLEIIRYQPPGPFRISYEFTDGQILTTSCFPSNSVRPQEPGLQSLQYAWELAERFASSAPDGYRNITVVGRDFRPVNPALWLRPCQRRAAEIASLMPNQEGDPNAHG